MSIFFFLEANQKSLLLQQDKFQETVVLVSKFGTILLVTVLFGAIIVVESRTTANGGGSAIEMCV